MRGPEQRVVAYQRRGLGQCGIVAAQHDAGPAYGPRQRSGDAFTDRLERDGVMRIVQFMIDKSERGFATLEEVADAVAAMGLRYVVLTMVDRDDLADGGAGHFAAVIRAIREAAPSTTVEVLTPDFLRKDGAAEVVVAARPDVYNHNLETVPRLYRRIRPGADYAHSVSLLARAKARQPQLFTKSGIMVGLGEERAEVLALMDDLRGADVDFLTIGQYLQPTPRHARVERYVTPDEFEAYAQAARERGFLLVSSTPLTRSSYHAAADFRRLQAARRARADHPARG